MSYKFRKKTWDWRNGTDQPAVFFDKDYEFATMLKAMECFRVCSFTLNEEMNEVRATEMCDENYGFELNKEQLVGLANELMAMAATMKNSAPVSQPMSDLDEYRASAGLCRWVMIRTVNLIDWWLYTIASTNGRDHLEIWAYHRGWLEMWPGRKERIEYSIAHRQEIEDWRNGGWRYERIERLEKRVEKLEGSLNVSARF